MVDKRRSIDLLPPALQTETLQKFFAATLDHLFQPESVEFLSGYIGEKPSYYNPSTDFYVNEPTVTRTNYQLPVTAINSDINSGMTKNIMFYDDIVNALSFYGANVNNHSRLFDQEYYSWAPPIDVDKLINYTQYVWVPGGPSAITLLNATDVNSDIIGQLTYTYTGAYRLESTGQIIVGELTLTTGLAIILTNDVTLTYNNNKYVIDGVGKGITLFPEQVLSNPAWNTYSWNGSGWNGTDSAYNQQYTTIARNSVDKNQWSQSNSWYHIDVITLTQTSVADLASNTASRPIIEFNKNILLWDYGWYGRASVTFVIYNISDIFGTIVGQSSFQYNGIQLVDGMRFLVTSDINPTVNNRIYEVTGLNDFNVISLTLVTDGQNADGSPARGDRCLVLYGEYEGLNIWFTSENVWRYGQQFGTNLNILFWTFDVDGNGLKDPSVYPNSNYTGNYVFGYTVDDTSPYDSVLGIYAKRDQFGSLVFTNYLEATPVTYRQNGANVQYTGYQFYQFKNGTSETFGNNWYVAPTRSRQYIVNDFFNISVPQNTVPFITNIDQLPAPNVVGQKPTAIVTYTRNQNETPLINGVDYTTQLDPVSFLPTISVNAGILLNGDRLTVKTWNTGTPVQNNGYYELPLNLVANPNNQDIVTVSQSQLLAQFQQIIQNQAGFLGQTLGANNYRDTPADLSLGETILQHRAPMLKLMLTNSRDVTNGVYLTQSYTDPMLAMQFAQREYTRFYGRFIRALNNLYKNGYGLSTSPADWITAALAQVNIGKTAASPWANSGYDANQASYCSIQSVSPTYIPPTASRLGVAPTYLPTVYISNDNTILQTHDGSRLVLQDDAGNPFGTISGGLTETSVPAALTNPLAQAWLQFELNIYNNMPSLYANPEASLALDIRTYVQGKWRTGDYNISEFNNIILPMFDRWVILNQIDYTANTTFNINDQFSFNYSSIVDPDGQPVPGNWRGIYRWYYDTDRPHTHPWEMLGFSQKPSWWDVEYGVAPYTSGNTHLWNDLQTGLIRQGPRAGQYTVWSRPGLSKCIPVDSQGNLLPPLLAGTVSSLPSTEQAKSAWAFGDGGPIESVWLHSQDYNFAIAQQSYLMKPAQFMEYCWDTPRTTQIYQTSISAQWIYIDTNSRRQSSQFYVHRENPVAVGMNIDIPNESNLTYFGSCGIQHWISEYLVSQSLNVTTYFGSLIRGGVPKLAHKVGAFINSNENSLRMTADSFGTIGYKSLLVPSENVNTYLYRSTSIGESFYGAVVVKQVSNGWQVYGYDGINPYFNIIPSLATGAKTSTVIGYQNVTTYQMGQIKNGLPIIQRVPYGTIFGTRQLVYDFIISYGRWLTSQGWIFDEYNSDNNSITNWTQAAVEFTYWSQANWANGNFIALSPFANSAKYQQEFGNIEFVSGTVNGTYPVIDKSGQLIGAHNLEILRYDDQIVVRPLNAQSIYGLRLFRTTIEHAIVIDNQTSFGDVIYDDLYNMSQPRLKLYAYRTNDWYGRLDAPGYFLYQNPNDNTWTMISNLEKTANDFRKYFNIDQSKNFDFVNSANNTVITTPSANNVVDRSEISDLSKHLFGYQDRQYLDDLILEDSTEFEFYQGFIKQKGTAQTITNITRNTSIVDITEDFEYYEEFALRSGRYGSLALNNDLTFIIPQNQVANDPQQITVFSDTTTNNEQNGVIQLIPNDPRFIVPPASYTQNKFPLRTSYGNAVTDFPTAGYVLLGETNATVVDYTALTNLYYNSNVVLNNRNTIWQFIDISKGWMVWQFTLAPVQILTTTSNGTAATTIYCDNTSGLSNGTLVTLVNVSNATVLNSTFTIQNVTATSFDVPQKTFTAGTGGSVYVYNKVRFNTPYDRDNSPPIGGWQSGDMAWVDNGDVITGAWTVYVYSQNVWSAIRTESLKVNSALMLEANLFSLSTPAKLAEVIYYDPAKGIIPGVADIDLDFKTVYDPAKYNQGDTSIYPIMPDAAWEDEHLGVTWWDLSAIRYINYEQSTDTYRWKNWGKIAPGTVINVYEWVRSPVPPNMWATYVAQNTSFSQFGLNYVPSGTVKNASNPAWTQDVEYDSSGNAATWYYFWVANVTTLPLPSDRSNTTLQIANILQSPTAAGLTWYAAIDDSNIIVSGVAQYLNTNDTSLQLIYTQKANDGNDHKQWELVRDGDASSNINEYFWKKLHDSLTGYDSLGNPVPDVNLNQYQRYGTLLRPRQSWFQNRIAAAEIYVSEANSLLSTIALRDDTNVVGWLDYFENSEPYPEQTGNWDISVPSLAYRNTIQGSLADGTKVLVLPSADTNYLWAIYEWVYQSQTWITVRIQAWNTANYWQYVDWYDASNNISSATQINYTVATLADLSSAPTTNGVIIKVLNNGNNLWELYTYISGVLTRVGLESGTIEILTSLYDGTSTVTEFDSGGFDEVAYDVNPYIEFGYIFNGIKFSIFGTQQVTNSAQLNQIFFSMINYVISEQGFVDWIIKTSHIVLEGFNQPLDTNTLYQSDNIDSLLSYINEMRPYRSKIREFISGRTTMDNVSVTSSDFDMPPYQGRILDPNNVDDALILSSTAAYQAWYNNYQTNPNLIRTMKTQILFDRVATESYGWDINPWDTSFWSLEAGANATFGAFDRIQEYYQPTLGMIPIDSEDLISVTAFRGVIHDSMGFRNNGGWNNAPWGSLVSWNANVSDVDDYLDIILQGGQRPRYDRFYGDGKTTAFKLSKIPQDVKDTAVWTNNVLKTYGSDWIIPNWVQNVNIVSSGQGYQTGEILKVDVPNALNDATVVVTQISSNGGITQLMLRSSGNFDIVLTNLVNLVYPKYNSGQGSGATVDVQLGGDTIIFKTAPQISAKHAVHILYAGETFEPAPNGQYDIITDGNYFVQPYYGNDHAEELYNSRLIEALRIDTFTQEVGGRPKTSIRSYYSDGIKDQFDLLVKPQDKNAVIVSLNNNLLEYGPTNDYVINFDTNRVVFTDPPDEGVLQIISFGSGGTSVGVNDPSPLQAGYNYNVGDLITLNNGSKISTTGGAGTPAVVEVSAIQATGFNILNGGADYKIGDILVLVTSNATATDVRTLLTITETNLTTGAITQCSITEPGLYTYNPEGVTFETNGDGGNANIQLVWGVAELTVVDQGLYAIKPNDVLTQYSITNPDMSATGYGLTVQCTYTNTIGRDIFKSDGVTTLYPLSFNVQNIEQLMVTVNGTVLKYPQFSFNSGVVALAAAPILNAVIIVTGFNSGVYSVIYEDDFTIESGVYTYTLSSVPAHTNPEYYSVLVIKNGVLMNPPSLNSYIADGITTIFRINYIPAYSIGINVYVDSQPVTLGEDYILTIDSIQFNNAPNKGSRIGIVVTNQNYSYSYIITGNQIEFENNVTVGWDGSSWNNYGWSTQSASVETGDEIRVITFTEDLSYGWITEAYTSNGNNTYPIQGMPYDDDLIMVFVNGVLQTLQSDYKLNDIKTITTTNFVSPAVYPVYVESWSNFMQTYAVWVDPNVNDANLQGATQTIYRNFDAPLAGNYTLSFAADSQLSISIDNLLVAQTASGSAVATSPDTKTIYLEKGLHVLKFAAINYPIQNTTTWAQNPAGWAVIIVDNGSSDVVWDTRSHVREEIILSIENSNPPPVTTITYPASIEFNSVNAPEAGSEIIIMYATGKDNRPAIAWRTLIDYASNSTSIAIDDKRKTSILSNVYVYTNEIEIEDITKIGSANNSSPGKIWINNELITYYEVKPAGNAQYPRRGFISGIQRGVNGTPDQPQAIYNTLFYYGDGNNAYFATESGTNTVFEAVYVDGALCYNSDTDPTVGVYNIQTDPYGQPAGRYVVFNGDNIPDVGWKNIRITSLVMDFDNASPVHIANSEVIDASNIVQLPGGYTWEPAANGLQYSTSAQGTFLREHSGTNS